MKLFRPPTLLILLAPVIALGACDDADEDTAATAAVTISHKSDLDVTMPAHLAIMDTMAWFGVPTSFSSSTADDNGWGNWNVGAMSCVASRPPETCDATGNREISSRYHPLDGIYSSSGGAAESVARIKLMLSNLRTSCDDSARIDAYAIQLNGTHYTSLHGGDSGAAEISYQSLEAFLTQADAEGRVNAVLPGNDASWYWNNGHYEGLYCADSRSTCLSYLQQDVIDMVNIANPHKSALRIDGRLVLHFFADGGNMTSKTPTGSKVVSYPTAAEWANIFANARNSTGVDFYSVGSHVSHEYFGAFDALSPWVAPSSYWPNTSGATVEAHAVAYAKALHADLFDNVPSGHVAFGNVAPGFDDFTEEWGQCVQRQMPPPSEAKPRDLDVIRGTVSYLKTQGVKGVLISTWDDWTEGTFFEPSIEEGTTELVTLRQQLGILYGDTQSASGDTALGQRWNQYGKTYPCSGGLGSDDAPGVCALQTTCASPVILEPTANETVGHSIDLRVQSSPCLTAQIAYIDGVQVAKTPTAFGGIDQWVTVTKGTHTLHVNGWEANGQLHVGTDDVTFTY